MLYRFSSITGRLVGTGIKKVLGAGPVESAPILYDSSVKFVKIPDQEMKKVRKAVGGVQYGEVPDFFAAKQRHFQVDNGIPIHLKGGKADEILYYATLVLCAVGVFECLRLYYDMSFPQKPADSDEC